MKTDALRRSSVYAGRPITKRPAWHGVVAWETLLNGMSAGMFLVAALGELASAESFGHVARIAYPVALVLLLADLMLLVIDLGDPWRFHHMLRVFKPSAPMSLGVWCLSVFSIPAAVAAILSVTPDLGGTLESVRKLAVMAGMLPALGAAAYKGVLFSTSAQPVWKDARWLGGYLTTSAVVLGCAEMVLLAVVTEEVHAAGVLSMALFVLLLLNAVPLGLLVRNVAAALPQREYGRLVDLAMTSILLPLFILCLPSGGTAATLAIPAILVVNLAIRHTLVAAPRLAKPEATS